MIDFNMTLINSDVTEFQYSEKQPSQKAIKDCLQATPTIQLVCSNYEHNGVSFKPILNGHQIADTFSIDGDKLKLSSVIAHIKLSLRMILNNNKVNIENLNVDVVFGGSTLTYYTEYAYTDLFEVYNENNDIQAVIDIENQ